MNRLKVPQNRRSLYILSDNMKKKKKEISKCWSFCFISKFHDKVTKTKHSLSNLYLKKVRKFYAHKIYQSAASTSMERKWKQ